LVFDLGAKAKALEECSNPQFLISCDIPVCQMRQACINYSSKSTFVSGLSVLYEAVFIWLKSGWKAPETNRTDHIKCICYIFDEFDSGG
jgi:hypothetical protein